MDQNQNEPRQGSLSLFFTTMNIKTIQHYNDHCQPWTGEKPYLCVEADGEHLSLPTGILYNSRIGHQKSDRRMFIECSIMLTFMILFIGTWAFCIIRTVSQSEPMTAEQIAIAAKVETLSDALDKATDEYNTAMGIDPREYEPDPPDYP